MKRLLGSISVVGLSILNVIPAGAQGVSTPVSTQENVRHVATVPPGTGGHVVVEGSRLYMGNYGTGLSAFDITDPRSPAFLGKYVPGPSVNDGNDPGARADAVPDAAIWDGRHIVSLGGTSRASTTTQTEFLDFTDPLSPELLWRFRGSADGEAHNGDIVDTRKLWLPSGGSGGNGLRIYDMSPLLQTPPAKPVELFRGNPHTMWGGSDYKSFYSKPVGGSFNHTHDIEVYTDREILLPDWEWVDQNGDGIKDPTRGLRDIALLAAAGGGNASGAVYVIDITNPRAPVVMSKWQNPVGTGHNAISYLHEAQFLHGDPNTIFVADEDLNPNCGEGRLYTVNISDNLAHVSKAGEWPIGTGAHDVAPCLGSHVFSSHDRHVFMGAYVAGLQVVDLRAPAQPKRAGRFVAEGMNSWGALYHKGVIYTGDFGARGLDVFEFIASPTTKGLVKVNNPTVTNVASPGGVTEVLGECDPSSPANGADGLIVPIPPDKRDGTHFLRSVGGAGNNVPYDLNVYWYDATCTFMSGVSHNSTNPDEFGSIPEGAAAGVIDLVTGPPMWVYAQIDPAPGFGFTPPAAASSTPAGEVR